MRVSYNWIKTLINLDQEPEKIAEILTDTGLEVEHVELVGGIPGNMEGLIVGEVKEVWKHPGADKLTVTKVNVGGEKEVQIVCGAPNVKEGQKVVVAPVGSTIYPVGNEPVKMKKAKIRGEHSEGMICAEDEIGVGTSHEGIIVLRDNAKPGDNAINYFENEQDAVFEIGLTPNRGDAASHLGVARDIRAVLDKNVQLPEIKNFKENNGQPRISVIVENEEACPRYAGIEISGVKVGPSPAWVQKRLRAIGLNPINNIVDSTNYILHELGQPIHAFDADKITGGRIVVRNAKKGEKIKTLDGTERTLEGFELVIADAERPMAIAGVFGGEATGVTKDTKSIFLESAYFNPSSIRKTAKKHGLNTDASFRYERGVDPNIAAFALRRVADLIIQNAGGEAVGHMTDHFPDPISEHVISVDIDWMNQFCGVDLSAERIEEILTRLDIAVVGYKDGKMKLLVPPYRSDVTRRVDIAEEVLRIHGYNHVRFSRKLSYTMVHKEKNENRKLKERVASYLVDRGLFEIMTNSQTNPDFYSVEEQKDLVTLLNPLSKEQAVMRPDLLHTSLNAIAYNKNRRMNNVKMFEFGNTYGQNGNSFYQNEVLHIICTGDQNDMHWKQKAAKVDHYYLKGITNGLCRKVGVNPDKVKKHIRIEMVSGDKLKTHGIKGEVWHAAIKWESIVKAASKVVLEVEDIPKFPEVKRDLAVVVNNSVQFSDIMKVIQSAASKQVINTEVFDVYQGKPLSSDEISYAISFTLSDPLKTLKDKEIDKIIKKIIERLEKELGATFRK